MKKAWDDIKSFVTIVMTIAYIVLTFMGKMTPEFQDLFAVIIAFYFGTQVEKIKQLKQKVDELKQVEEKEETKEDGGVG